MHTIKRKPGRPAPPRPDPVDPTPAQLAPATMASKGVLSIPDAAKFLGNVHTNTIRNLIGRKQLASVRVGRRVMVPLASLEAFLAMQQQ